MKNHFHRILCSVWVRTLALVFIAEDIRAQSSSMALIPGGSFQMGDSISEGNSNERPVHTVSVSSFYIEKLEVSKNLWSTVVQWALAHGYVFDSATDGGGYDAATTHPAHPIWYDAVKWCNARSEMEGLTPCYYTDAILAGVYRSGKIDIGESYVNWSANGYRLPTEAEWEKAARGGLAGKRFPWGDSIDGSDANYLSSGDPYEGYFTQTTPVGYYNGNQSPSGADMANGYGLYDMAGNALEFCWDWLDDSYYSATNNSFNPHGPPSSPLHYRVMRGGSWEQNQTWLRCSARSATDPSNGDHGFGFRCVRAQAFGTPGLIIKTYQTGASISSLADADNIIKSSLPIASSVLQLSDMVGFDSGEGTGHFSINTPVPGIPHGQATDNYAVQGTGWLIVSNSGNYTFGLNTDDGGRLRIDGANTIVDDVRSPPHDSSFVSVFLSAGPHFVEWTWFNEAGGVYGGGAEGEAFVAPGIHGTFDSTFRLLGDANGLPIAQGGSFGIGLQTLPPSAVTSSSAELRAAINPNGSNTWAHFEYGTTLAYGNATPPGNIGTNSENVGFVVSGLLPGNTYHFRVVASNSFGISLGNDMQFTTLTVSTIATQAWVAGTSGLGLRLRDAPSLSATVPLVMPEGANVVLLGDTQTADGYLWRHVAYSAQTGWAAARYLIFSPGTTLQPPPQPTTLRQLKTDGKTPIIAGATVNASALILAVTPSGTPAQEFTIQFEVEPSGTVFSNPTVTTGPMPGGSEARVTISSLSSQSYRWRARVLDVNGVPSPWVTFSANPADFIVATPLSLLANFTYSPSQIFAGDTVTFSAEAAGQSGLTFSWDFGGGQTASGPTATHAFAQSGDTVVTLTVTDGQSGQTQKAQTISVASKNLVDRINAVAGQSQSLLDDLLASAQKAADAADYFNLKVQSAPGEIEMTAALRAVSLGMSVGDNNAELADRSVEWVRATYGDAAANNLIPKLAGILVKKEIRDELIDFTVKETLKIDTAGEGPTQIWMVNLRNLVAQKRAEIESLRAQAVAASGSLTPAQSAVLIKELQARLLGNIALRDSYVMNANLPITFHDLQSEDESGITTYNVGQFIFSVSASLGNKTIGVMAGPVGAFALEATETELDIFSTLATQSAQAQLLSSSIAVVGVGPAAVNRVTDNIESCLNLIIQAQTPPATPTGTMVAVTPYSVGKFWTDNLRVRWVSQEAYADVTIENTGSQDTTYRLEAFLTKTFVTGQLPIGYVGIGQRQYDIQTAVARDGIFVASGKRTTQRLYFLSGDGGQVPEGQDITYVLTAHTSHGEYRQDVQLHHFGTTYIDENGNVVDPALITSASVVQDPLRASLLVFPGTNFCQLSITVQNPAETPLLMTVGQEVPSGTIVLNAGGAVVSNNHLTWELDMQAGQIQFLQAILQLPSSLNDPPLTNTIASGYDSVAGSWIQFSQAPLVVQIVSSPPPQLQPLGLTNGSFGVSVQTLIPGIFRIDATSDFLQWTPISTVTNAAPFFNVNDSAAANYPARFYRALRQ